MLVIRNDRLRKFLGVALPFAVIPALVAISIFMSGKRSVLLISLGIAVCSYLLFLAGLERENTGTGRLVIVAVLTALCVVGRFIPFFKPIAAITILAAVWLGGGSGFLVGSSAALVSDFYFGIGPWTPFQMLAWGMIGLFAGSLSTSLKKSRLLLLVYGGLSGVFFSMVMDVWTVVWYHGSFDLSLWGGAMITAIPHTVLYAVSNVLFLWLSAKPIGEKLERIRIRYGI